MKQDTFTDIEYSYRKKKTKREEFLEIMDKIIPRNEWVGVIEPYYPKGKRDRPPMGIEKMLKMYLLRIWFNLSDPATEDDCRCHHYQCPGSTKNAEKSRDPEMHRTKKGNEWRFGMKCHIGVDTGSGLVHAMTVTAANEHDITQAAALIREDIEEE